MSAAVAPATPDKTDEQKIPEGTATGQDAAALDLLAISANISGRHKFQLGAAPDSVTDAPTDRENCDRPWFDELDIRDEHLLGRPLKQTEIDRFAVFGIDALDLCSPWPVMADRVIFQPNHIFNFARHSEEGTAENAFIIGALGLGGLTDLVAWDPRTDRHALWLGSCFALGEAQIFRPNFGVGPLPIWRSPLGWLRAGRTGIVILQPHAVPSYLCDLAAVAAEDANHRRDLERMFVLRKPRIFVSAQAACDPVNVHTWR
jgi:hypothetical protein